MPPRERRLAVLQEPAFRRLFVARTASVFGDSLVPLAITFAVIGISGRPGDVGLVLVAGTLPVLGLTLFGGVAADRLPRQRLMAGADLARCGIQATTAALLITDRAGVPALVALQVAYGVAEAAYNPAITGLVPSVVSTGRLQEANALLGISGNTATLAGPAVAGILVATWGPGVAIAIDSMTFLISAILLVGITPRSRGHVTGTGTLQDLREGWHEFRSRTWLWVMVAHWALFLLFAEGIFDVLGPLIAAERLGGAIAWGAIEAFLALGMLVGRVVALRYVPRLPGVACLVAVMVTAPSYLALAQLDETWVIAATRLLAGGAFGFYATVWITTLQQHVPDRVLSRVSAYEWTGSMAFLPLGYALAGPLSTAVGSSGALTGSFLWVVVSTGIALAVPAIRLLRATAEPER